METMDGKRMLKKIKKRKALKKISMRLENYSKSKINIYKHKKIQFLMDIHLFFHDFISFLNTNKF